MGSAAISPNKQHVRVKADKACNAFITTCLILDLLFKIKGIWILSSPFLMKDSKLQLLCLNVNISFQLDTPVFIINTHIQ